MKYRAEIDGLRALAVLPVALFHADFELFEGGFIGVDIFFVISGYLITTIILTDLHKGQFSIAKFYERRARRILPALFFVMFISCIFAYAWMMPDEFKNFGQSLVATSLFSNNILLALTSGYWDLASEFKPLLHTWSLGVEEEFYILFPFILIFCKKNTSKRKTVALLILAMVASYLLANWGVVNWPQKNFYILPTRAWEILLGVLTAYYLLHFQINIEKKIRNQLLSFLGLLLIAFSIALLGQNYPSPGFYMLIPTVGAVLIILYAVKDTFINQLLSSKVIVGVGLLSYGFYLWHQPLLAFSRIYFVEKPTQIQLLSLLVISLLLAYLTWRFVEKPFRNQKKIGGKFIFVSSISISIGFIFFGYYLNLSYGMQDRVYQSNINVQDMDKRRYNEKIYFF